MLDFERPLFLLAIPAAAVLLWLAGRGSLARWTRRQSAVCWSSRLILLVLLGAAAAGPRWMSGTREAGVVFLRDVSASIGDQADREAGRFLAQAREVGAGRSAEILFASRPVVERAYGSAEADKDIRKPDAKATDLAAALEFAAALLPDRVGGRIVLLTDGRTTAGRDPAGVVADLAARGVEFDVVPLISPPSEEIAVEEIALPANLREGEVFDLPVRVHATKKTPATVKLYQNNLLVGEQKVEAAPGTTALLFPRVRAEGRFAVYDAVLEAERDTLAENNRSRRALAHGGKARVLLVDRDAQQAEPLAGALRAGGFAVDLRPPEGFPAGMEELENFDLVILGSAPATDFRGAQLEALRNWVKDFGGGLIVTGGENSFGAGGYYNTPLAVVLPVRIQREEREDSPVIALLVILDRSGSMAAQAGGEIKMNLANEGAVLALDLLQGKDLFGVFAVDTRVQEIAPLARVADKNLIAQKILAITAGGGGIYIYTSLAEAYPRLRDVRAKIKHIILFSDAADAEEKNAGERTGAGGGGALDLASAMLGSQITLSVVALGNETDRDTAFLRQLAAQGGGRFYLTADAATLPRLFAIETMRATQSSLREDAVLAVPRAAHPVLEGIDWNSAPPLLGYNITGLKPGAEMPLAAEGGEPLLALWRYGLGQVAAFASDARARWAAEWLGWPGFGKFWIQLARQTARPGQRRDLDVSVSEREGRLHVTVDAVAPDGALRNGLPVKVSAAGGSATVSATAAQTGPGRYEAILESPAQGAVLIAVSDGQGQPASLAWARDYPPEFSAFQDGEPALRRLVSAGTGKWNPAPAEAFRPVAQPVASHRDLAPYFLAAALILLPFDIWARRREWGNSLPQNSPAL